MSCLPGRAGAASTLRDWPPSLSGQILIGLAFGLAGGCFFGEFCAFLSMAGDAFIGLLRLTVLP